MLINFLCISVSKVEGRVISYTEGHLLAKRLRCEYREASAQSGEGVASVFETALQLAMNYIRTEHLMCSTHATRDQRLDATVILQPSKYSVVA